MRNKNTSIERRRHPRMSERLQFKLKTEDFDVLTETINLSPLGVYCQVNKHIPLMTSLKMVLALPHGDEEKESDYYVETNGVVVRVEEVLSEADVSSVYNIAIYFNEIKESDKEKLANYFKAQRHS